MKRRVLAIMVLAAACTSSESRPSKVEARESSEPERRVELPSPTPIEATIETREIVSGPAGVASIEQRRAAVLAILTDGSTVSHLPLDADP